MEGQNLSNPFNTLFVGYEILRGPRKIRILTDRGFEYHYSITIRNFRQQQELMTTVFSDRTDGMNCTNTIRRCRFNLIVSRRIHLILWVGTSSSSQLMLHWPHDEEIRCLSG